jgi:ankyrin repeat protein
VIRDRFRFILFLIGVLVVFITTFGITHRDRRPPLYFAAENGDTNALAKYLAQGTNINAPVISYIYGVRTATLLHIAARKSQPNAVDFLLKNGADPNLTDYSGNTPLLAVINHGENADALRVVNALLKGRADPNLKSRNGYYTPLISAAMLSESKIVQALLISGADVRATNNLGQTALHYAANGEIAKLLIGAGANPTASAGGETPAQQAVKAKRLDALQVITNWLAITNR